MHYKVGKKTRSFVLQGHKNGNTSPWEIASKLGKTGPYKVNNVKVKMLFCCSYFVLLHPAVKYERIKFLVIALKNSVEIYAWAPKPYHKFMAFKVRCVRMCLKCESWVNNEKKQHGEHV